RRPVERPGDELHVLPGHGVEVRGDRDRLPVAPPGELGAPAADLEAREVRRAHEPDVALPEAELRVRGERGERLDLERGGDLALALHQLEALRGAALDEVEDRGA